MSNPGVYPVDPTTPVGMLRVQLGDIESVPLAPPVEGQQDYTNFSDAQLEQYLTTANGNSANATGMGYLALAAQFAAEAVKVTADDLALDLTGRAANMTAVAKAWFTIGAGQNAAAANDYFAVVYPKFNRYRVWEDGLDFSEDEGLIYGSVS